MDRPQNTACPECRAAGHDKTGDHLFLLSDGETYICRTAYHPRKLYEWEGDRAIPKTMEKYHQDTKEDVLNYPVVDFEMRGIRPETFKTFDVRYCVDQEQGQPDYLFFPVKDVDNELIAYHRRGIQKKTFGNTPGMKGEDTELFGNYEPNKIAVVTEGQLDALSIYQVLKDKYSSFTPTVYSTNNGTGDFKSIVNTLKILKNYDKVLLCFDNDEPGDFLTSQAAKILGKRAFVMDLGKFKDANEALQADATKHIISAFYGAESYRPSGVVSLLDIQEAILEPVQMGLTFPFPSLDKLTYGLRRERMEIISIAAAPGAGKSLLMYTIIKHLIFQHKEKLSLFPLEENPIITGKKLVGSVMNKTLHIPDCIYDKQEARAVLNTLNDFIYIFDHQGSKSWSDIESVIRYQSSFDIGYFVIDPLTALSAHLSTGEANEMLNKMLADLSTLVNELGITVFLISHLNNAKSGKSHEEGGKVRGSEFTGSRAVWRWSTLMLGLSRNLLADDEEERNTSTLSVIKNRFSGDLGGIKLRYDKNTAELQELATYEEARGEAEVSEF